MVARFVRDEEAAGSNPVIPTTLNLSNQAVSEVFILPEKPLFFGFDHMLATFYASNAVVARLCSFFNYYFILKYEQRVLNLKIQDSNFYIVKLELFILSRKYSNELYLKFL